MRMNDRSEMQDEHIVDGFYASHTIRVTQYLCFPFGLNDMVQFIVCLKDLTRKAL
jgi:hypothetical protein